MIPQLGSARRTPSVLLYYKLNLSGGLLTRVDLLTTVGLGTAFGAVDTLTDTGVCVCSRVGTVVAVSGSEYVITGCLECASVSGGGGISASGSFCSSNAVFCFSPHFHLALCRVSSRRGAKMVLRLHRKVW